MSLSDTDTWPDHLKERFAPLEATVAVMHDHSFPLAVRRAADVSASQQAAVIHVMRSSRCSREPEVPS